MNRLPVHAKDCASAPVRRESAKAQSTGLLPSAEAEAAALCAMKLAEAERQARDGRRAVCCG